jgi:hypothetical protein
MASALDKVACVDASSRGQQDRSSGRLLAAHERFVTCSSTSCPEPVRQACAEWLNEVERATPSVVLAAQEASRTCDGKPGSPRDLLEADVLLDGHPLLHGLDGRSVDLDPGRHVLRFVVPGRTPHDETVVIREGQKARPITVIVAAPPPQCASPHAPPAAPTVASGAAGPPAGAIVASAVSVAGLGALAYFGFTANSYYQDHQYCAPHCGADAKATLERLDIAADVGLGVGVVAAAVAVWLWFAPRHAPPPLSGLRGASFVRIAF